MCYFDNFGKEFALLACIVDNEARAKRSSVFALDLRSFHFSSFFVYPDEGLEQETRKLAFLSLYKNYVLQALQRPEM